MEQALNDFIGVLRQSGVRISVSESLDAFRAADLVSWGDREALKDALASCLAKSFEEKVVFGRAFDHFFGFRGLREISDLADDPEAEAEAAALEGLSPLALSLLAGGAAELSIAISQSAQAVDLSSIRFSTQRGPFVRRILDQMGWDALNSDVSRLAGGQSAASLALASELERRREALFEKVRAFVQRQVTFFAGTAVDAAMEEYLRSVRLSAVEERDFGRMEGLIRKMVKRLNSLYSRRWKTAQRGQVDFKKILRKNIAFQGIPFDMSWKARRMERAQVVAICDTSRSVRAVVRFFLLFLYGLNEALVKIRSFAFCSNLVEVTGVFDEYPVSEAVARIQNGAGIGLRMGVTDYGQALVDLKANWLDAITSKTTVIVLGDGRNNRGDPQVEILKEISSRCRRLIWLNPESPSFWGTGDSEMDRYLPHCHIARQCNTVKHLERVVDTLLRQAMRV